MAAAENTLETVSGVWIVDQFVYSWVVQGKFLILD
jgi:hypothetical protein